MLLEWLAETRADSIRTLLHYCLEARRKRCELRDDPTMVSEIEDCEAVNLGCLTRQFPDPYEPTETSKRERRSVVQIREAIYKIKHFEDMHSLDPTFKLRHEKCDIGHFIQGIADRCIFAVQGQSLRSASSKPLPPTWFNHMLADLRSSFPDARIQGALQEAHVFCLTDYVARIINVQTATTVAAPLPVLSCLDCPVDGWIIPRPEKISSEFVVHLQSTQHLRRVQRRLDSARNEVLHGKTGENRQ